MTEPKPVPKLIPGSKSKSEAMFMAMSMSGSGGDPQFISKPMPGSTGDPEPQHEFKSMSGSMGDHICLPECQNNPEEDYWYEDDFELNYWREHEI